MIFTNMIKPARVPSTPVCCGTPSLGESGVRELKRGLPSSGELEAAAELFSMAANPVRLSLLAALRVRDELCVCDLADVVGQSIATVSAHLQRMKSVRLVGTRRVGRRILYSLEDHRLCPALDALLATEVHK